MTTTSKLATDALAALHHLFGPNPGIRTVHSRGVFLEGEFVPASPPATLSRAAFLRGAPSKLVVRFSNFFGDPNGPDNVPQKRGFGVRFFLADGDHTDVVAHSFDGFPARTPEDFVAFLGAVAGGEAGVKQFAAAHPESGRFLGAPDHAPVSYATEAYFAVHAFRYVAADGKATFGRPRFEPVAGVKQLSAQEATSQAPDYLRTELKVRLAKEPVVFRYVVQLAAPGDPLDDVTRPWPADRPLVELGTLRMTKLVADEAETARRTGFLPTHLVDGIEPPSDPIFPARGDAYKAAFAERN